MTALTMKAWQIGQALKYARKSISMLHDDTARMLKITREELTLFENGEVEIPKHILETIFALGLMMMHTRAMQVDYHHMARQWRYMHTKVIDLQKKVQKFDKAPNPALQ